MTTEIDFDAEIPVEVLKQGFSDFLEELPEESTSLYTTSERKNMKDDKGITELHDAARRDDPEKVMSLIRHYGADVDARDINGSTPLHYAVAAGASNSVGVLLLYEADIDAKDNRDRTLLHVMAIRDKANMAKVLFKDDANIWARDIKGRTPLHYAALCGPSNMAKVLLKKDPDVSEKDSADKMSQETPWEMEWVSPINARDIDGKTPLDLAEDQGHSETADVIRSYRA